MAEVGIVPLREADLAAVVDLARAVWQSTYPDLIPQAQIDFMLADRYSVERIREQLNDPEHGWLSARRDAALVGFTHFYAADTHIKLDKLYVAPEHQRQGVGRALFDAVCELARMTLVPTLRLQVNRGNVAAIAAYQKWGCVVVEEKVFDIGHGYVMDDYVMERAL